MQNVVHAEVVNIILYNSPGTAVIKLFSCSTQLSTNFQLLVKTKILTTEEVILLSAFQMLCLSC